MHALQLLLALCVRYAPDRLAEMLNPAAPSFPAHFYEQTLQLLSDSGVGLFLGQRATSVAVGDCAHEPTTKLCFDFISFMVSWVSQGVRWGFEAGGSCGLQRPHQPHQSYTPAGQPHCSLHCAILCIVLPLLHLT